MLIKSAAGTTWLQLPCGDYVTTYTLNDLAGVVPIAGGDLADTLRGLLATGAALQLCFLLGLLALRWVAAASDGSKLLDAVRSKLAGARAGWAVCLVSCFGIMSIVMVAVALGLWNANYSAMLDAACSTFCNMVLDYCINSSGGSISNNGYYFAAYAMAMFTCGFCASLARFYFAMRATNV